MKSALLTRRQALSTLSAWAAATSAPSAVAALRLPPGQRRVTLPFELIDNRLFVQAKVNGRGPLHFIFDTGGGNILDTEVARSLGLPLQDSFTMPGAGDGTLPAWRTRVEEAQVGALQMQQLPFVVLPLQALRRAIGFARLDGLIGHEVLRRFVVQLDFVKNQITLSEPDQQANSSAETTALPIEFSGNLPLITGHVDGVPARMVIDSGDRSSLTLFTPFVDDHQLRQARPRRFAALTGFGVGGPLHAEVTRVQELLLGPLPVHGVTTRMPTGRGGVFASRAAHASVGTGVLKRLDVTFDYSQRRVLLAPNAHHRQPDPVDHSGLWLSQGEGVFVVEHVSANSAASAAGLRTGDQVLAVDGQAASQILLPELRQRWAAAGPGLAITLTMAVMVDAVTAAQTRQRSLKLQDRFAPAGS